MRKFFTAVVLSFLSMFAMSQNGNNNPCGDIISSYNSAVTNATQINSAFAVLHNSVSSLEVNPHSNGQGNGNNPWQSQGNVASGGQGAQVGFSVMMPQNKGFINVYFDRNNSTWIFQYVQGTFPNYCTLTVTANCQGATLVSNTCP